MNKEKIEAVLAQTDFVRSLARSLVFDESQADDISQQALLAAMESRLPAESQLRAWFSGVVRNLTKLSFRRERSRFRRERMAACPDRDSSAAEEAERKEARRIIVGAVLELDEPYQSAITQRYFADLNPSEIADKLNIPVETVKTRLKRGVAKLRDKLDREFGDRSHWCLALAPLAGLEAAAKTVSTGVAAGAASTASGGLIMATKVKTGLAVVAVVLGVVAGSHFIGDAITPDNTAENQESGDFDLITVSEVAVQHDKSKTDNPGRDTSDSPVETVPLKGSSCVTVVGKVLDESNTGMAGVRVEEAYIGQATSTVPSPEDAKWEYTGIVSQANGSIELQILKSRVATTCLRFVHPDYRPADMTLLDAKFGPDGKLQMGDIVLERGFIITGRVIDSKGQPVAGCVVSAPGRPWVLSERISRTETREDGRFRLNVRKNSPTVVTALIEQRGLGWSPEVIPGKDNDIPDVTICVHEGQAISGTVFYSGGTPAVGQMIACRSDIDGYPFSRTFVSGAAGRFRLSPLPVGVFTLYFRPVGVPGNVGKSEEHILADRIVAGTENLRLVMPQASRLVVALSDEFGNPVNKEPKIDFRQIVTQDEDSVNCSYKWSGTVEAVSPGVYGYRNIVPGTFDIGLRVNGYANVSRARVVVPEPPDEARLNVTLVRERQISGKVTWPDGSPAIGVRVSWEQLWHFSGEDVAKRASFVGLGIRTRTSRFRGGVTMTDGNGIFLFPRLSRPGSYYLYFSVDGREILEKSPVEVSDESPQVELSVTLPEADGVIKGSVYFHGSLLAEAFVLAWNRDDFFFKTRADEYGNYTISGLPDGRYIVDARAIPAHADRDDHSGTTPFRKGFENLAALDPYDAEITDGGTAQLDLHVSDPWNSEVSGWIDTGERQLPDKTVVYFSRIRNEQYDRQEDRPTAADLFYYVAGYGDGEPSVERFHFKNLTVGLYRLTLNWGPGSYGRPMYRSLPINLGPSAHEEIRIELSLSDICGTVVEKQTDVGIANARIILLPQENGRELLTQYEFVSTGDGSFAGENVPAADYNLIIRHDEYAPFLQGDVRLVSNVPKTGLRFELDPGNQVEGRIVFTEAKSYVGEAPNLGDYYVYPSMPPLGIRWESRGGRVAKDGSFVVKGLPTGEIRLIVQKGSKPVTERLIELPLANAEEVIIEVPPIE